MDYAGGKVEYIIKENKKFFIAVYTRIVFGDIGEGKTKCVCPCLKSSPFLLE